MHNGPKKRKKVKAGDAFQVLPYDAETRFTATDAEEAVGPWRSTSPPPEGSPVEYRAEAKTAGIELDEQTRKMLEQLGYMQGDDE